MSYLVKLQQFEGPLDLLLHLIEEAQVDIKDIFVSEITSQYLAYMGQVDRLDMDTASEFLTMAATLVYIKSRQLLPRPPKEETEEEDPEAMLIRQLREYKAFKEASSALEDLFTLAREDCTRLPEDVILPPKEVSVEGATLSGLFTAFSALLAKAQQRNPQAPPSPYVRPDVYTVRTQMGRIREKLKARKVCAFEDLFSAGADKMEMIVTFMALLEMINHGEILLKQSAPFAPIRISVGGQMGAEDADYEYMDETED